MSTHFESFCERQVERVLDRECERRCLTNPLQDKDALYVLNAMRSNDFENLLNAMEQFLVHLELTDDSPTFTTAANWIEDAIHEFDAIDEDGDGSISADDLQKLHEAGEGKWLSCHFDALINAALLPQSKHELNIQDLKRARNVFLGLAIVQKHLPSFHDRTGNDQVVITDVQIDRYLAMHIGELGMADYLALLELGKYLKALNRRFVLDNEAGPSAIAC